MGDVLIGAVKGFLGGLFGKGGSAVAPPLKKDDSDCAVHAKKSVKYCSCAGKSARLRIDMKDMGGDVRP
jgi:hypothetical protein